MIQEPKTEINSSSPYFIELMEYKAAKSNNAEMNNWNAGRLKWYAEQTGLVLTGLS